MVKSIGKENRTSLYSSWMASEKIMREEAARTPDVAEDAKRRADRECIKAVLKGGSEVAFSMLFDDMSFSMDRTWEMNMKARLQGNGSRAFAERIASRKPTSTCTISAGHSAEGLPTTTCNCPSMSQMWPPLPVRSSSS